MKYDLVIFDLDGTLLDTSEGIINAVKRTIIDNSLPMLEEKEFKTFIGPPVFDSYKKYYKLSESAIKSLVEQFRELYSKSYLLQATPYNGIFGILSYLLNNNIKIAIATYKREDYAIKLLNHFGFDRYADVIHGADDNNILKKSDIIKLCIKESGVADSAKILMIGDTDFDKIGAGEIGIDFLGVTWGFGYKSTECSSLKEWLIDDPKEIENFLVKS